jgi:hypothetical protein
MIVLLEAHLPQIAYTKYTTSLHIRSNCLKRNVSKCCVRTNMLLKFMDVIAASMNSMSTAEGEKVTLELLYCGHEPFVSVDQATLTQRGQPFWQKRDTDMISSVRIPSHSSALISDHWTSISPGIAAHSLHGSSCWNCP